MSFLSFLSFFFFSFDVMGNMSSNNCVSGLGYCFHCAWQLAFKHSLYGYLPLCAKLSFYSDKKEKKEKRKKHTLFAVHLNLRQAFFISIYCGVNRSYFIRCAFDFGSKSSTSSVIHHLSSVINSL